MVVSWSAASCLNLRWVLLGRSYDKTAYFLGGCSGYGTDRRFPLKEMAKRGWIPKHRNLIDHGEKLLRILIGQAGGAQVAALSLYRTNGHRRINAKTDPYALRAWCWRVLALANVGAFVGAHKGCPYKPGSVTEQFMREVAQLSVYEDGPRRAAQRLLCRFHRDADRTLGRQHARRLRRLHQRLRHPARGRRRRHRAHLLREPPHQAGAARARAAALAQQFEEVTEGEEVERTERLKSRWARLEALVGAENRVSQIAADIVSHFEQRLEVLQGKAMVVCMSRRICIDLYRELVRLRPGWEDQDDGKGAIKVVMTGSASDPLDWQPHIRNKARREALAQRFRDPDDPLQIVLVRDMWLTGFDAPSLHTLYVDKPMRGHGLM